MPQAMITQKVAAEVDAPPPGKTSMAYNDALTILAEQPRKFNKLLSLHAAALGGLCIMNGVINWFYNGEFYARPVGYFSALFLGVFASVMALHIHTEVRQLRRRLDATIALLQLSQTSEIDLKRHQD